MKYMNISNPNFAHGIHYNFILYLLYFCVIFVLQAALFYHMASLIVYFLTIGSGSFKREKFDPNFRELHKLHFMDCRSNTPEFESY